MSRHVRISAALLTLLTAACVEDILHAPASAHGTVMLEFGASRTARIAQEADGIRVQVTEGSTVLYDSTHTLAPGTEEARIRVELAIAERADLVVLVDVLGGGLLLSRGRETVQLAPGQVAAVEVALVALPNFTIRAPEQVTGQLSRAGTADVTLTCDLTSTLTNTGIATLLAQRATFTLLDLATGALLAGPTSDGIGVWGTGPFAPSGGPHEAIQRYTWTDQDRAAGFEAQYDLTMVATGDSAMDEATASYTVRCEPPPAIRDMSGVWTGLYAWDCGGDGSRTGSAAVSLELIQEGTSLSGVIRYRGGSAPVTGVRLSDVEFGEFGSRTGIPDPSGLGVALSWPTSSPYFVNNALWGFLGDTGAEVGALALNGDSPAGESAGCSAPSNSSGSFDLQRPSAAAER